jgi:hypothetical protein
MNLSAPLRPRRMSAFEVWPLAVRAQQPAMPVIGYLDPGAPEARANLAAAFHKGLSETGYVEGRNEPIWCLPCGGMQAAREGMFSSRDRGSYQVIARSRSHSNAACGSFCHVTHFRSAATLSMPALLQASSLSPPGAPETPMAPITSSPTLIGSAPWAVLIFVSESRAS